MQIDFTQCVDLEAHTTIARLPLGFRKLMTIAGIVMTRVIVIVDTDSLHGSSDGAWPK